MGKRLIRVFPRRTKASPDDELAAAAGYSPTSTSYTNPRGALKTKRLADYPEKGMVRAADWLFPETRP